MSETSGELFAGGLGMQRLDNDWLFLGKVAPLRSGVGICVQCVRLCQEGEGDDPGVVGGVGNALKAACLVPLCEDAEKDKCGDEVDKDGMR